MTFKTHIHNLINPPPEPFDAIQPPNDRRIVSAVHETPLDIDKAVEQGLHMISFDYQETKNADRVSVSWYDDGDCVVGGRDTIRLSDGRSFDLRLSPPDRKLTNALNEAGRFAKEAGSFIFNQLNNMNPAPLEAVVPDALDCRICRCEGRREAEIVPFRSLSADGARYIFVDHRNNRTEEPGYIQQERLPTGAAKVSLGILVPGLLDCQHALSEDGTAIMIPGQFNPLYVYEENQTWNGDAFQITLRQWGMSETK